MDNDRLVMALLGVIIILLIIAVIVFVPSLSKEDSNMAFSDKSLVAGDSLVVSLNGGDGKAIQNETVHLKLTDDGNSVERDVVTNSKGKAKLKVDEKGKYSVEASFDGNAQYSATKIKDNISVKKVKTEVVNQQTTTSKSMYDSNGFMYPEYGPDYDSVGTSREKAMAGDYRYLEDVIDGRTVGVYAPYDPVAGGYHW